jgi:hypothetical protein
VFCAGAGLIQENVDEHGEGILVAKKWWGQDRRRLTELLDGLSKPMKKQP